MSQRLATSAPATRLPALLSLIGSSIICAGFLYPCLYVRLDYIRYCVSLCVASTVQPGSEMLIGAEILFVSHPSSTHIITGNPPYPTTQSIEVVASAIPLSIIAMLVLVAGTVLLLMSVYAVRNGLKPWLFRLALITAGIGIASLIFNTGTLLVDAANPSQIAQYPYTLPLLGISGHILLYVGYALALAGIITMYRQQRRTTTQPQLAPTPSVA